MPQTETDDPARGVAWSSRLPQQRGPKVESPAWIVSATGNVVWLLLDGEFPGLGLVARGARVLVQRVARNILGPCVTSTLSPGRSRGPCRIKLLNRGGRMLCGGISPVAARPPVDGPSPLLPASPVPEGTRVCSSTSSVSSAPPGQAERPVSRDYTPRCMLPEEVPELRPAPAVQCGRDGLNRPLLRRQTPRVGARRFCPVPP